MSDSDVKKFIKDSFDEILIEKKETLKRIIEEILTEMERVNILELKCNKENGRRLGIYDLGGQFDNLNIRDYAYEN